MENNMKKTIFLDICNTLADVNKAIERLTGCKRPQGLYFHPSVNPQWFEDNLEVFEICKPISGAAEGVRKLAQTYNIVYATARSASAAEITQEWLKGNGFPDGEIIYTRDKVKEASNYEIAFVIDDAPHEILAYAQAGIPVLVYGTDYNRQAEGLKRISWRDILNGAF